MVYTRKPVTRRTVPKTVRTMNYDNNPLGPAFITRTVHPGVSIEAAVKLAWLNSIESKQVIALLFLQPKHRLQTIRATTNDETKAQAERDAYVEEIKRGLYAPVQPDTPHPVFEQLRAEQAVPAP